MAKTPNTAQYSRTSNSYKACVILIFLTSITSILLNIVAIVFLLVKKERIQNSARQRNNLILLSLCIANLLYGLAVIADFSFFVNDKEVWIGSYMVAFSLIASLLHVLMLTFERFLAVRFPFKYKNLKLRTVLLSIALIWIFSVGPALTVRFNYNVFLFALFIVLLCSDPITIFVYVYIFYATRLTHRSKNIKRHQQTNTNKSSEQGRITTICCTIVITYVVSTTPSIIWYLVNHRAYISPFSGKIIDVLLFWLLLFRSVTDSLIYIFRDRISKKCAFLYRSRDFRIEHSTANNDNVLTVSSLLIDKESSIGVQKV